MTRRRLSLGLVLFATLAPGACDSNRTPAERGAPRAPTSAPRTAATSAARQELAFIERVTGSAQRDDALPMIVAIHGLGDRPEAFSSVLDGFQERARIIFPRAPQAWGSGFAWFPFHPDDSPETRARGIEQASERVVETIRSLVARRPTVGKPIVTGFSQGGMLSFAIAAEHPDLVRAAIPVSGVLPELLFARIGTTTPRPRVVALHGEIDSRVPLAPTRRGVEVLVSRGFDARLETFPNVGHQIPSPVRARWLELLGEETRKR